MKLLINKKRFIDWYFDHEVQKEFFYRHGILSKLKESGSFSISIEDILQEVGYLPEDVVEDGQELLLNNLDEVDMRAYDEIKFS